MGQGLLEDLPPLCSGELGEGSVSGGSGPTLQLGYQMVGEALEAVGVSDLSLGFGVEGFTGQQLPGIRGYQKIGGLPLDHGVGQMFIIDGHSLLNHPVLGAPADQAGDGKLPVAKAQLLPKDREESG